MWRVKGRSAQQRPQTLLLVERNLHLYNTCYRKSRAPFTCQLSYSSYSSLLSGILPRKNRKFFVHSGNDICHVQAMQSMANIQKARGLNSLVEDSSHRSTEQEALLALIMHEDWFGLFFSLLCWLHARCHEPGSHSSPGCVRKGKSENEAWGILHLVEPTSFAIKNTKEKKIV